MPESPGDQWIGARIREYEILERIGRGGMGAVYRARHVYLDEERAIKLVQTELANSQDFVNRFIREAKILAKLHHSNLVQLFEFGTLEDNQFFMVLELLRGESVLQRIKKLQRIILPEALRIIREAAMGLRAGHQKGIIHRDLSPDNLLLVQTDTGIETTKVIDFGIARPTAKETQQFTRTNMFVGKLEYVSPEQCGYKVEGDEIDQRSDIYSLAITMYHMITGRLPFTSNTPHGYINKHLYENPRPLSAHVDCGTFPPELDRFISKALAKERNQRHSSMTEVIEHLSLIEASLTPTVAAYALNTSALPLPGTLFANRYLIEKRIGEGGMGTVFKAMDRMLDVSVAIKALNRELVSSPTNLNRLKREVIFARKVGHPNVCRIYDIGEADGVNYLSMEYIEGHTLSEILHKRGALPPQEAISILTQVLNALGEAHRAGIVHRDLKPQNVMINETGYATVMDFGISFSADAIHLTQTGMMVGTPRYMAPEQFSDQAVDSRADLYSSGVILYEMLTGRAPFDARTPASMMYAHLNTPPPKPSQFSPLLPRELESIVLKALEKDPSQRFQNASEFISAFNPPTFPVSHSATPLPHSEPEPILEIDSATSESPSRVLWITCLLFLLLAAAGAAYYFMIYKPRELAQLQRKQEETQIEQASEETGIDSSGGTEIDSPGTQTTSTTETTTETQPLVENSNQTESQTQETILQPTLRHFTVQSTPDGALIFIDQQDTGLKTPHDVELHAGNVHELELRLVDYENAKFTINDETSEIPVLKLIAILKPGILVYEGNFPVTLFINKKLLFNSQQKTSSVLKPGTYELMMVSNSIPEAYIRNIRSLTMTAGDTIVVQPPRMSQLTLTAQPSNCVLFVDGEYVDTAPIFNYPLQSGLREIRVVWEKLGKEKTEEFDFPADEKKSLRAVIESGTPALLE